MDCKVFVDECMKAFKQDRSLVVTMTNGARVEIYPQEGMEFTLPKSSQLVSPYAPEGYGCSFITRQEAHSDSGVIGVPPGRYRITLFADYSEEPDIGWLNLNPEHVTTIHVGGGIPPHMSRP